MLHREDLKGRTVIVREPESLEVLLETKVLEYNRDRALITISDDNKMLRRIDKVSVIILGRTKAYEFLGSTRRLPGSDRIDLALFNCKTTPIRAEPRYSLNSEALIEEFVEKKSKMLRKLPFKVYIVNVSATGALVEPVHLRFEVGEIFNMRMHMGGTEVLVTAQVIREERDERSTLRYGCKFLKVR